MIFQRDPTKKFRVVRNGTYQRVASNELTVDELCEALKNIGITYNENNSFIDPRDELDRGRSAINEAIRRLQALKTQRNHQYYSIMDW